MATPFKIPRATVQKPQDVWTSDFLKRADGTPLLISDISTWDLRVFDTAVPLIPVYTLLGVTPTAIGGTPPGQFSNSPLAPDGYSDEEYNFRHQLPATAFVREGGHTYQLEYQIHTVVIGTIAVTSIIDVYPNLTE